MDLIHQSRLRPFLQKYGYKLPKTGQESCWQFVNGQLRTLVPEPETDPDRCYAWYKEDAAKRWRPMESGFVPQAFWGLTGFNTIELVPLPFTDTGPRLYVRPFRRKPWREGQPLIGAFDLSWVCDVGGSKMWRGENFVAHPEDLMQMAESMRMRQVDGLDFLDAVADFCVDHPDLQRLRRIIHGYLEGSFV